MWMMTLSMIDTCVDTIESWVKARGWLVASLLCWKIFFLFFLEMVNADFLPAKAKRSKPRERGGTKRNKRECERKLS